MRLHFFALSILCCLSLGDVSGQNKDLREALMRGQSFLRSIQRADGAICDTINPLFDTWETALAATALYEITPDTNDLVLKNSRAYLRANEDAAGLVCHNKKCREAYCLETTTVYFLFLLKTGDGELVRHRTDTIFALQKTTGAWDIGNPDVREQKDFPSVTAFILNLWKAAGMEPRYPEAAISWLLSRQTPEGHWGNTWEYYNCPAYALWPVMQALQDISSPEVAAAKQKAVVYMLSQQQPDGSWEFKDPARKRMPSRELQTALMLSALEAAGCRENEAAISKGIDFLLASQQPDGSWNGGYFPIDSERYKKEEYVFATARAIGVLEAFRQYQTTKP